MDLYLMDQILKGNIPRSGKVLDIGCGNGRNGIYFLQNGFEYHGWDKDKSSIRLLAYLAKGTDHKEAAFKHTDFLTENVQERADLIICSRVLHFADSRETFFRMWEKLVSLLKKKGILYVSMDSTVDTTLGKELQSGQTEFPDSKLRFALTLDIFKEMKKGFEEIEPLITIAHHNQRAQSFLLLKKN